MPVTKEWIVLYLVNDDTRPSGYISRLTQVAVSLSCFQSLNKLIKPDYIVHVLRLVEVTKNASIQRYLQHPTTAKLLQFELWLWMYRSDEISVTVYVHNMYATWCSLNRESSREGYDIVTDWVQSPTPKPLGHKGIWMTQSLTLGSFATLLPTFLNPCPVAWATFNQGSELPLRRTRVIAATIVTGRAGIDPASPIPESNP